MCAENENLGITRKHMNRAKASGRQTGNKFYILVPALYWCPVQHRVSMEPILVPLFLSATLKDGTFPEAKLPFEIKPIQGMLLGLFCAKVIKDPASFFTFHRMWPSSMLLFSEMSHRAIARNNIAFTAAMSSEWCQSLLLLQD